MDTTTRLPRAFGWATVGALTGAALNWAYGEPDTLLLYGEIGAAALAMFGFVKGPGHVETAEEEEAGRAAQEASMKATRQVFGKAPGDAVTPPTSALGHFDDALLRRGA